MDFKTVALLSACGFLCGRAPFAILRTVRPAFLVMVAVASAAIVLGELHVDGLSVGSLAALPSRSQAFVASASQTLWPLMRDHVPWPFAAAAGAAFLMDARHVWRCRSAKPA